MTRIYAQKLVIKKNDDAKVLGKLKSIKRIRETIDDITACPERKRGILGAPLAYLIKKEQKTLLLHPQPYAMDCLILLMRSKPPDKNYAVTLSTLIMVQFGR